MKNNLRSYLHISVEKDLQQLRKQRQYSSIIVKSEEWDKLREMVARCEWTFAKSMPWCPHEYIVRTKCSLTEDDFVHFVKMQRNYGTVERWGNYITPYLYIDDYKYWTMGGRFYKYSPINRYETQKTINKNQGLHIRKSLFQREGERIRARHSWRWMINPMQR